MEGGGCVGWRVRRLPGQPSPEVGEAKAAIEGVSFAIERGWHNVIVEGDCATVISAIQSRLQGLLSALWSFYKTLAAAR